MYPPRKWPSQRLRLYGPSLLMLVVLTPFFSYYIKQVKNEGGYLNDRAFRTLDLIAREFDAEIEGAHSTMEAALLVPGQESNLLLPRKRSGAGDFEEAKEKIRLYLHRYIPDAYLGEGDETIPVAQKLGDEPVREVSSLDNVKAATGSQKAVPLLKESQLTHAHSIAHFEDSQIYVELNHQGRISGFPSSGLVKVRIFLDPRKVLARALGNERGAFFDTVFVASGQKNGRVLAQKSNPQVNVLDVDTLLTDRSVRAAIEASHNGKDDVKPAPGDLAAAVSGANERYEVEVSGTDYVLFVIPAPFYLMEKADETRMAFYGLVRKDAIQKQALGLPKLALLLIGLLFCIGWASLWPVLKLYTMSDRERLKRTSVFIIFSMTLAAMVFVATLFLSGGLYLHLSELEDDHLAQFAGMIENHLAKELGAGIEASSTTMRQLLAAEWLHAMTNGQNPPRARFSIDTLKKIETLQNVKPDESIAKRQIDHYPFFEHIILTDRPPDESATDEQILKLSANAFPTPLIALPSSRFPFVGRLLNNPNFLGKQEFVLQSFISPNTGEFLPIVMFPYQKGKQHDRKLIMLTTQLPSLVNVIVPDGYGFAVINEEGTVEFHSDSSRNLKENFFSECLDPDELRRAIRYSDQPEPFYVNYGGRKVKALVQPLLRQNNLGLNLIVYSQFDKKEGILYSAACAFIQWTVSILAILGLFGALVKLSFWTFRYHTKGDDSFQNRVWPRSGYKTCYLLEILWWTVCLLISVGLMASLTSYYALLAVPLGLALLFPIVRRTAHLETWDPPPPLKRIIGPLPLSVVYSTRTFVRGLAVVGIFSMLLFESRVKHLQASEAQEDRQDLTLQLKKRADRILADLRLRGDERERSAVCGDSRQGFDIYNQTNSTGSIQTVKVCSADLGVQEEDPWRLLPRLDGRSVYLYGAAALSLAAIFIWLNLIIRRLYLLDFREPELLPLINEHQVKRRMESALQEGGAQLDRLMIFAHPQSGTGVMIVKTLKSLANTSPPSPNSLLIDFGRFAYNGPVPQLGSQGGMRKIVVLDNFETRLGETENRRAKLELLESAVSQHVNPVYIFTSSDPLLIMESLLHQDDDTAGLEAELDRWVRVLSSFERFMFSDEASLFALLEKIENRVEGANDLQSEALVTELAPTIFLRRTFDRIDFETLEHGSVRGFEESLAAAVGQVAEHYYGAIWQNCTSDERLALYQLARDRWLNPQNKAAISHLWLKQLITTAAPGVMPPWNKMHGEDGPYRLMNRSFGAFVVQAVSRFEIAQWKQEQNESTWPALRMSLVVAALVMAVFVFYVRRDLFDVYFGYVAAAAGGGAAVMRLIIQFFTGRTTTPAGAKS